MNVEALKAKLLLITGVKGLHNFHVWELSSRRHIAAVHLVVQKEHALSAITEVRVSPLHNTPSCLTSDVLFRQAKVLLHEHGVHNTTVQAEYGEVTACWEPICSNDNCMIETFQISA